MINSNNLYIDIYYIFYFNNDYLLKNKYKLNLVRKYSI